MKKLLTLLVAVCMLLSVIPFSALAEGTEGSTETTQETTTVENLVIPEAPTAPEGTYTVYVSGTGDDASTDPSNIETPVQSIEAAYAYAVPHAADKKLEAVAICVLSDGAYVSNGNATAQLSLYNSCDAAKTYAGTVYIYGVKKEGDTYPTVSGTAAAINDLVLTTDTVFYNIGIDNGSQVFNVCAAFHKLTFGNNFTAPTKCNVTGAVWRAKYFSSLATKTKDGVTSFAGGANINIYSGTFAEVYAAWRDASELKATGAYYSIPDSVVNVYGGKITTRLQDLASNAYVDYIKNTTFTFNMYSGTVSAFFAYAVDSSSVKHTTLNYDVKNATIGTINVNSKGVAVSEASSGLIGTYYLNASMYGSQTGDINGANAVRFIARLDSVNYQEIGMKISAEYNGVTYTFDTVCNTVYKSIIGMSDAGTVEYKAESIGGNYIMAVAIYGIPAGTVTFTVQPYAILDETHTYWGAPKTIVVTYETDKTATTVSLMSLNLQNNNNNADVAGTLSTRLGTVAELITAEKPDSVGVQECDVVGTLNMRSTLNTALENSGYQCVLEETTEGGGYAFKNFIWVNADTTKVISSGEAWLSETPTVPSKGFGTAYYISMGWAVLENIATGEQYVHVNTHLTAYGTTAGDTTGATDVRVKEIGVLLDKVEEFTKAGYTVFLTGDMNSTSSGTEYKTLTATLSDTRKLASTSVSDVTFHNYGNGNARTIDYCFVSAGANFVGIESYAVEKTYNNKYLSDHSALIVTATVARTAVNG